MIRDRIWFSLVDAKTNEYYTSSLTKTYQIYDWILNTFLVVATSASVAAWAIWAIYPLLWSTIIGLSQILMLIKPFLLFPKYIKVYNEKNINLQNLSCDLEELWCKIEQKKVSEDIATEVYDQIKRRLIENDKFPDDVIVLLHKKALVQAEERAVTYLTRIYNGKNE